MEKVYEESLSLHREHRGKLEISSKVPLKDKHDLSLAYTPGVAEVCRQIATNKEQAKLLTVKGNSIAVVTDGSAVLGLGNIGPEAGLPVMEGKCLLFKEFAGVDAWPICLAAQDTEEIIAAVKAIAPGFGGINLEDISAPRCFEIERRLREELDIPVMHDDQHGTATVVLAGLINAWKVRGGEWQGGRIVISGAGAAGTAIAELLWEYGFRDIILCDRQGIIGPSRLDLNPEKQRLLEWTNPLRLEGDLAAALEGASVFIGVSAGGLLKAEMIKKMADNPIIFALANPIPEIIPEEAKAAGALVVATGRSDYPNQVNNVLVFPGVFRGALDNGVKKIGSEMLIRAAKKLAALVVDLNADNILPDALNRQAAIAVAEEIY
jgi:malate dehydrogenase (oxaloacetate-decarboxylating)